MPSTPIELNAEPRTLFGKHVRRLRRQGITPANMFGHGESRAFQAPARVFEHLLTHGGRTNLVSIALEGGEPQTGLLKTVQRDPKSGQLLHLDFQAVSLTETVSTTIPLRFVGEAPAVTREGGIMTHPMSMVRIEARASEIPDYIEVDVSKLTELHMAIHISDLRPFASVRLLEPDEEVVAVVLPPKVEAEEVAAALEAAATTEGEPEGEAAGEAEAATHTESAGGESAASEESS